MEPQKMPREKLRQLSKAADDGWATGSEESRELHAHIEWLEGELGAWRSAATWHLQRAMKAEAQPGKEGW